MQPHRRAHRCAAAGKMELLSPKFYPAVTSLLDAAPLVIGTVPVARYGRSIPQVAGWRLGARTLPACASVCPGDWLLQCATDCSPGGT